MNWITDYINKNSFNWERVLIDHDHNDIHCSKIMFGKFLFRVYGNTIEESHESLQRITKLVKEFVKKNPEAPEAIEIFKNGNKFKFEISCEDIPHYVSDKLFMFKEEAGVYGVTQMAFFYEKQKQKIKKDGLIDN